MTDINDPRMWVERAEEDLTMARSALRRKVPLPHSACFHAQQCAEKYLKALLVEKGATFPKVHDLLLLNTLCEQAGVLLAMDARELNTLSEYAVIVRYPGNAPTPEEAREAISIARNVRRVVRRFLGL